jgi:hypothetical protein
VAYRLAIERSNGKKKGRRRMRNAATFTVAAALALFSGSIQADEAKYDAPVSIDLVFIYHIDADLPEQDAFVIRDPGSNEMWRATKGDQDLSQPIYASHDPVPHNPFDPAAAGPYPVGPELPLTLGEWFGATGVGAYSCVDGTAQINASFNGLVPNGVYTMWHWFSADPPTEPFKAPYDIPVGSRDGTDSIFIADADGNAQFVRTMKPCLQLTGEHLMAGLAIAWHSDGKTYGPHVGDLGKNAHVPLFLVLPKRSGI